MYAFEFFIWLVFLVSANIAQNTIPPLSLEEIVSKVFNKSYYEIPKSYKSCGFQKECVPFHLCENGQMITDGTGLINARTEGGCSYFEVCCQISLEKRDQPISSTIKPSISGMPVVEDNSEVSTEKGEKSISNPVFPTNQQRGCGLRNRLGIGFFSDKEQSEESEFGEFPWMVAILFSLDEIELTYKCGGSILSMNVILTAAHCVQNLQPNEIFVRAGEWDLYSLSEILPYQDRRVKDIIIHERYNNASFFNDVALLILEKPFVPQDHVHPVCLPEANQNFNNIRCFFSGWGKDKYGKAGKYQHILKKIELPIVPHSKCQDNLRQTYLGLYYELDQSFVCAGGEDNKSTSCQGDGGSPLVCPDPTNPQRFYQAGIVAFGIQCGAQDVPGVYSSIPHLRSWIDEKLQAKGIGSADYSV